MSHEALAQLAIGKLVYWPAIIDKNKMKIRMISAITLIAVLLLVILMAAPPNGPAKDRLSNLPVTGSQNESPYPETLTGDPLQGRIRDTKNLSPQNEYLEQESFSNESEEKTPSESQGGVFLYQLQDADFESLLQAEAELIILDPDDSGLEGAQLGEISKSAEVLAYLSIGEAEDYRDYWKESWDNRPPGFIGEENPDWEGNYKVEYWNEDWQELILSRLEHMVEKGYGGVYFDIVDAYEYHRELGRDSARGEMIDFVTLLSARAKGLNPDFLIITQNAVGLYPLYSRWIDGIAREDLFFDGPRRQEEQETEDAIGHLRQAKEEGKIVLVIDYPSKQEDICTFYELCFSESFLCLAASRELNLAAPLSC